VCDTQGRGKKWERERKRARGEGRGGGGGEQSGLQRPRTLFFVRLSYAMVISLNFSIA
jgi:hypothetical protein